METVVIIIEHIGKIDTRVGGCLCVLCVIEKIQKSSSAKNSGEILPPFCINTGAVRKRRVSGCPRHTHKCCAYAHKVSRREWRNELDTQREKEKKGERAKREFFLDAGEEKREIEREEEEEEEDTTDTARHTPRPHTKPHR